MAEPSTFTAVDLSRLPAPTIVEILDFDMIYRQMLAQFVALVPDFDATVESDPAVKLLQVAAYREMLLRARVNDAARAVMPAYATGTDLDNLAALMGVVRLIITPANPQTGAAAVLESDEDFRRRLVLAPEGYSVAGPEGAYIFHSLSASSDVLDASATSPATGEVRITILARAGTGVASAALLATVLAYVSAETRRPLTDYVTIQSAEVVHYAVEASIRTFAGPDGSIVIAEARARLAAYIANSHRLGRDITRSGIFAALHVEGVQNVVLTSPATDVVLDRTQAGWCTATNVVHAGLGE
ncbi:phage-related baseplate assembly protein [Sphingomonas sp. PP-F2F-A104-K0414]|uniref:baseplate assembly protein n=1 Tax=Sphingomonas sp. PP-F2F-A104-K0414 TaxID=2135661 RepID=UPI0010540A47|nr:baseplate J/gp47 family protein [Sphingomonas sp. PP-F2F-A104-K0414]TCP95292.1 phage-related baseplate assembly protein [Sphingomonas sp. PP-F2F-A104-K0414]